MSEEAELAVGTERVDMRVAGRTRELTTAGLICAMLAAAAWIQIPLQPVPITLQVLIVLLAALMLSPAWAFGSVAAYLVLGALGVPVFSGAQGGMGVLAGPTGGYLFGFLFAAGMGSSLRVLLKDLHLSDLLADAITAAGALIAIYFAGVAQLAMVMELTYMQAIVAGALPFLAVDAAKAVAAVVVASAVRRALGRD